MTLTQVLHFTKATKHTYRYDAPAWKGANPADAGHVCEALYIQQSAFGTTQPPKQITLRIELERVDD
jgi:hypothetical protein